MKTFKKVLALLLVVALTATAAVSMTLAYLQDDDEAVNTMTLGNVYIDQIEQERGESGLEDFQQDKPLYPAIGELTMTDGYWTNNNVVDKIVTVTNTGASEAYVRTVYAFEVNGEDDFEALLHINWADGVVPTRIGVATIDDSQYVLYEHIYGVMQPGDSAVTLKQVALDWSATNEDVEPLGSEYKILVVSQAIQTNGFDDAETALNAGFGDITTSSHPWVNGIIGDRWDGTSDPDALEDNTNKDTKTVEIYNAEQLKAFADSVNGTGATTFSLRAAATGNSYAGYTVKLMANIDLNNVEWTPIGSCDGTTYFQGTFDGQGYTISNLKVDRSTDTYGNSSAGLFGWVDQAGATIKNVKIDKATVKGSHWVGAVVGYMTGTISDCTVTNSTITGFNVNDDANGDKVGGIVGMVNEHSYINNNTVADCTISGNRDIGGIAGAVTLSTKEMNNNKVKDTVITYTTARSDYASAGEIVSGRTGYVANDTNTVADVIVGQVGDNGLIADANNARTYLITSADDLVAFNSYVATGVAGEGKAVTAKLLADIDMAGKTWPAMNGHWVNFDGQGHTISNLTPTANNVGKNGFVGYLGAGNISNLTLKNVNVVGAQAGIFAGQNEGGSITNCKIEGTNTVVWKQNTTGSYVEEWGGIGAVIGVNNRNANINAEIKSGAVVTLNKTDLVTQCAAIDNYVGYLNAYTGAVTNNGTVKVIKETEATDNASLDQAIQDGASTVTLSAGNYTVPSSVSGKDITIVGSGDNTVFDFTKAANVGDASITFENVKFQGPDANSMNGFGIQHTTSDIVYKNCTFDGAVTSEFYGTVTYENCTFTGTYYIATYAVKSATFIDCTFDKTDSRAILVYSHGDNPVNVLIENCTFKAAGKGHTWSGDWTAAVEVDTTNIKTAGTTVTIKDCTYDANNYSGIVRDKSAAGSTPAVITVDGVAYQK